MNIGVETQFSDPGIYGPKFAECCQNHLMTKVGRDNPFVIYWRHPVIDERSCDLVDTRTGQWVATVFEDEASTLRDLANSVFRYLRDMNP